jgi:hypothetical protein
VLENLAPYCRHFCRTPAKRGEAAWPGNPQYAGSFERRLAWGSGYCRPCSPASFTTPSIGRVLRSWEESCSGF